MRTLNDPSRRRKKLKIAEEEAVEIVKEGFETAEKGIITVEKGLKTADKEIETAEEEIENAVSFVALTQAGALLWREPSLSALW
ncbi:hypothetical protein CRYUN_Cryun24cG0021900 [Craigia yunnanensis]